MEGMHSPEPEASATQAVAEKSAAPAVEPSESPTKTGLWILGVMLIYYAIQAWLLPAAGVQT